MAIVTYTAGSRGASVTLTVNDVTLLATSIETTTTARQMRITLLNELGQVVQTITPLPNTTATVTIAFPARLVEIEKANRTIKSYVVPPFAVFF